VQVVKFQTPLGRALYNALFNPAKVDISELFLPRRTAFVYDLDANFSTTDIPTTLRRSKADCPPVRSLPALLTTDGQGPLA
jgi:IK cytokine